MADTGIVTIHGKEYSTVAKRINDFRKDHPDYGIRTEALSNAEEVVVQATITDSDGNIRAQGLASEERNGDNKINRTSALENCETSAVGRALAFFGLGGTEIASANEIDKASLQAADMLDECVKHQAIVRKYIHVISELVDSIEDGDFHAAIEKWRSIPQDDQITIYKLAPSKGGILSTEHRAAMKSDAWAEASKEMATKS